jgi:hypothetical protein
MRGETRRRRRIREHARGWAVAQGHAVAPAVARQSRAPGPNSKRAATCGERRTPTTFPPAPPPPGQRMDDGEARDSPGGRRQRRAEGGNGGDDAAGPGKRAPTKRLAKRPKLTVQALMVGAMWRTGLAAAPAQGVAEGGGHAAVWLRSRRVLWHRSLTGAPACRPRLPLTSINSSPRACRRFFRTFASTLPTALAGRAGRCAGRKPTRARALRSHRLPCARAAAGPGPGRPRRLPALIPPFPRPSRCVTCAA